MTTVFTTKYLQMLYKNVKGFDNVINKIKITVADKGNCVAELKIDEDHVNMYGGLHGGFSATLVDCIGSFALLTHEQAGAKASVSVNMQISSNLIGLC